MFLEFTIKDKINKNDIKICNITKNMLVFENVFKNGPDWTGILAILSALNINENSPPALIVQL